MEYDETVTGHDKKNLYKYRTLLTEVLLANSTGILKKCVVVDGFSLYSQDNRDFLTSGRHDQFLRDEAYTLTVMIQAIKSIKKNMSSGARLPSWLKDLVSLLDNEAPVSAARPAAGGPAPSSSAIVPYVAKAKRRLLKRRSSVPSTDSSSASEDSPPKLCKISLPKPGPNTKSTKPVTEPMFWFSESDRFAKMSDEPGKEERHTSAVEMANGFVKFVFPSGAQWKSDVPILGNADLLIEDPPPLRKRPAMPKASRSSVRKKAYSKAYHEAAKAYERECKAKKIKPNIDAKRRQAARAAQAAVAALS